MYEHFLNLDSDKLLKSFKAFNHFLLDNQGTVKADSIFDNVSELFIVWGLYYSYI